MLPVLSVISAPNPRDLNYRKRDDLFGPFTPEDPSLRHFYQRRMFLVNATQTNEHPSQLHFIYV